MASSSKAIASTLHQCLKYTDEYGNEKIIRGDANPCHGKDVNYADAKFYKSTYPRTSQVSLDLKGGKKKEKPATLTLPQKVIRVVNSYASRAMEYQSQLSKALFKYAPEGEKKG